MTGLNVYGLLFAAGVILSATAWSWLTRRQGPRDPRLAILYLAGLFGGLIGAKLAFLFAEGWLHWKDPMALLTGRSITGALLGGYGGVEIGKRILGYERTTGDLFAVLVPLAIALGRIGCLTAGCCAGIAWDGDPWWAWHDAEGAARWPAQSAELLFNLVFLAWVLAAHRRGWAAGNRFHVYLIAYGGFRFAHEFLRERTDLFAGFGGYHLLSLGMLGFGLLRYTQRKSLPAAARGIGFEHR